MTLCCLLSSPWTLAFCTFSRLGSKTMALVAKFFCFRVAFVHHRTDCHMLHCLPKHPMPLMCTAIIFMAFPPIFVMGTHKSSPGGPVLLQGLPCQGHNMLGFIL